MKIAIACGGTGGHVFPGLATAEELRARGHEVTVWLSGKAVEADAAAGWTGRKIVVHVPGVGGRVSASGPLGLIALFRAVLRSFDLMRADPPRVLLAMGSYASVGPVIAAWRMKVPVVLHEANAVCGRAVDHLSRFAHTVALTFPETRPPRGRRSVVTGLPLRSGLGEGPVHAAAGSGEFRVLVMGGSQGARTLNETCPPALGLMRESGLAVRAVHLAGRGEEDTVRAAYARAGVAAGVHGFLADMRAAYAEAHVAVCRSGAGACWELAAAGLPAVYVPLPSAARDHQRLNALHFRDAGAAVILPQNELTAGSLADVLGGLARDPERLGSMRAAQRNFEAGRAAARLADVVESAGREKG